MVLDVRFTLHASPLYYLAVCTIYVFMTLHRSGDSIHTFSLLAFPYVNSELLLHLLSLNVFCSMIHTFSFSSVAIFELSELIPRPGQFKTLFLFFQSLGSGFLDVRKLLNLGINVCLGTGRISLQQC